MQGLLNEKQTLAFLGYSEKSSILSQMRMPKNKGKWDYTPRYIVVNNQIRYPLDWLNEDIQRLKEQGNV